MRTLNVLLATIHFLSMLVVAHPFIIVHTKVTETQVAPTAAPTHHYEKRLDVLDNLASGFNSFFGIDEESTSSPKTSASSTRVTLLPPVTASSSESSDNAEPTSSADGDKDDENDDDEDKDDENNDDENEEDTTTTEESKNTDSSTSTTDTSTATEPATTTATEPSSTAVLTPSPTIGNSQASATTIPSISNVDNSNGMPSGGVAVAVIMSLLIVAVTAWLIFKYHPKSQAWWAARQERKFQERSYRDGIDGPEAGTLRQQALGGATLSRRQTIKSFFAPKTVNLGGGKDIKRKPVNWGVESPNMPPMPKFKVDSTTDTEKISMKAAAAPMGQIESYPMTATAAPLGQIERYSLLPPAAASTALLPTSASQAVSPVSLKTKQSVENLPPISPLSPPKEMPAISAPATRRDLPGLSTLYTAPKRSGVSAPTTRRGLQELPVSLGSQEMPASLPPTTRRDPGLLSAPLVPPKLPQLVHAKRGSDGVFRLV